jgi:hypothetical protein
VPHDGREALPVRGGAPLKKSRRREALVGRSFQLPAGLVAEVRRACREELRLHYRGPCFDARVWSLLAGLGDVQVLEASKLNPRMKDVWRVRGAGFRLEGALGGEALHAFYSLPTPHAQRHRVEAVLVEALRASKSAVA